MSSATDCINNENDQKIISCKKNVFYQSRKRTNYYRILLLTAKGQRVNYIELYSGYNAGAAVLWSHAKSNPAALRRQSWHITQETRRYGRDLPLLAHGLISALSAAASCRSRSKACWIERGKVNTARLPVEDQFAHRLSGYRRPQNAPTIVPSRHERVREVGHASHIPISAPTPYVNTRPFLLQISFQKKTPNHRMHNFRRLGVGWIRKSFTHFRGPRLF